MTTTDYIIGLGSNLGERLEHLRTACTAIAALPGTRLSHRSPIYQSAPIGPPQPDYLNAAVRLASELQPDVLLAHLQAIEAQHGRQRADRWGPRTLDLDILWSSRGVNTDALRVPHPELTSRWFALRPLLDVAPELGPEYAGVLSGLAPPPSPLADTL